ncbi:terminase small subunit, partial [Escherichia coli 10.0869]
MCGKNVN